MWAGIVLERCQWPNSNYTVGLGVRGERCGALVASPVVPIAALPVILSAAKNLASVSKNVGSSRKRRENGCAPSLPRIRERAAPAYHYIFLLTNAC